MNLIKTVQVPVNQVLSFVESGLHKDESNLAWFSHNSRINHNWVTNDDVCNYRLGKRGLNTNSDFLLS